jgi:hypothetical protein
VGQQQGDVRDDREGDVTDADPAEGAREEAGTAERHEGTT